MVMLGMPTTGPNGAPAPEHAATLTRGARINILYLVNIFVFVLNFSAGCHDVTGYLERPARYGVASLGALVVYLYRGGSLECETILSLSMLITAVAQRRME